MFLKGYPWEAKTAPKNWNQSVYISWTRLASLCHLGVISDPLIVSKFHNKSHDPKGQEHKIYTIVKGRKTFYCRHTVPVTKPSKNDCDIILLKNDTLILDQKEVSGLLNDFYIIIAREIGIDSQSPDIGNHPSIEATRENTPEQGFSSFNFKPVDQSLVSKSIKKLNPKRSQLLISCSLNWLKVAPQHLWPY